jgi:hypothetical protein
MLDEWYELVKPMFTFLENKKPGEIDYITKYNLIGFNIDSKVKMVQEWHHYYGRPLLKENLKQSVRKFIYMYAEIYSFSPSTIRVILNNVLLIDSKNE